MWEGLPAFLFQTLRWTTRTTVRELCDKPLIIPEPHHGNKNHKRCAVCLETGSREIYPRYVSKINQCCLCGVYVHASCHCCTDPQLDPNGDVNKEAMMEAEYWDGEIAGIHGNIWKCWSCQYLEDHPTSSSCTCAICGHEQGYLIPYHSMSACKMTSSSSSCPDVDSLCHISCILTTFFEKQQLQEKEKECDDDEEEEQTHLPADRTCDVCHGSNGVLQCSIPSCSSCFHSACMKGKQWCLFFQASTDDVSFYVCCEDHYPHVRFMEKTDLQACRSYVVKYANAPQWVRRYNRMSVIMNADGIPVLNNAKSIYHLSKLFASCGLTETTQSIYQHYLDRLKEKEENKKKKNARRACRNLLQDNDDYIARKRYATSKNPVETMMEVEEGEEGEANATTSSTRDKTTRQSKKQDSKNGKKQSERKSTRTSSIAKGNHTTSTHSIREEKKEKRQPAHILSDQVKTHSKPYVTSFPHSLIPTYLLIYFSLILIDHRCISRISRIQSDLQSLYGQWQTFLQSLQNELI